MNRKKQIKKKRMSEFMNNKKGFTLIELLAVIVILGLLMAIAIPSVTRYITQSRKKTMISTIDNYSNAAISAVNDMDYGSLSNGNNMYYIPIECIHLEKGGKDPFGEWKEAYVVVNYRSDLYSYDYYFTFYDSAGYGMELTPLNDITQAKIVNPTTIDVDSIKKQTINDRSVYVMDKTNCNSSTATKIEGVGDSNNEPEPQAVYNDYCFQQTDIIDSHTTHYTLKYVNLLSGSTARQVDYAEGHGLAQFETYKFVYNTPNNEVMNCLKGGSNFRSCSSRGTLGVDYVKASSDEVAKTATEGCYVGIRYCLAYDTEIEVYDKKKKKRKKKKLIDVTYDDLVLAWDFDSGKEVFAKPLWIMKPDVADNYVLLTFSDGSTLKVITDHRIYNADKGMFTPVMNDELTPIGTKTYSVNGEYITLVSKEVINEEIKFCNMIAESHINFFGNGIITSWRLNNIYRIDEMKFIKDDRELRDLSKIESVPEEWLKGIRAEESLDTIEQIISDYNFCKERKK